MHPRGTALALSRMSHKAKAAVAEGIVLGAGLALIRVSVASARLLTEATRAEVPERRKAAAPAIPAMKCGVRS